MMEVRVLETYTGFIVFECDDVVIMASHAIFQYNILVIDIDNTTLGLI